MDKDLFISYLTQLGYRRTSVGIYFLEDTSITIDEKIDYYTSWYGNHPTKYYVNFYSIYSEISESSVPLETLTLNKMFDLIEDYQRVQRSLNKTWVTKIYESNKANILRTINRDNKLNEVLK